MTEAVCLYGWRHRKVGKMMRQGKSPCGVLTAREAQVVEWIAKGNTNKQIASHLRISSRTVQTHVERMFKKLGVRSRAELVAQAYLEVVRKDKR